MALPVHVLRADRSDGAVVVGFAAVAVYFAVLVHGMGTWPYEQWMVLVLVPLLFTAGVVGILVVTRDDTDRLTSIMVAGLVAKLGAAFVRYFVVFAVYRGGDSIAYDVRAEAIADAFHDGRSTLGSLLPTRTGTGFIDDLTGLIYTVMGPSRLGGFLVYAFIGYWGLVLFHRAARIGLPSLDERRYAMLLYFMPALVFWPSSIGKEAVMMLAIGCAAFGAARVLERRRNGLLPLAAGVGLTYQVRPHVAFVLMVALAVAILFRRRLNQRPPIFGPVGRLISVVVLAAVASLALAKAVDRFLPSAVDHDITEAGELLDRAESGTADGGSEIARTTPTSPLDYPNAAFTVLFRPTLLEVNSVGETLAALETTIVLVLAVTSWRRLKSIPRMILSEPYLLFAIVYTVIFTFAWSAFANFGALVRQRVQVWPFVLILLSLPAITESASGARERRANPVLAERRR